MFNNDSVVQMLMASHFSLIFQRVKFVYGASLQQTIFKVLWNLKLVCFRWCGCCLVNFNYKMRTSLEVSSLAHNHLFITCHLSLIWELWFFCTELWFCCFFWSVSGTFDLTVPVDALFFIGSQLVATSHTGKIGVWNSMTQHWQVQCV